jgi:rod shape-determining protein MreD
MRSEYFIPLILFFPLLLLQTTFIPLISINGIIPDLILILLVFYTIKTGQIYGTVLGFILGFFFDLITGSLLGSAMIAKTAAGFTAGYFSNENKQDIYLKTYAFSLIVLLCAIIDSMIYSFFSSVDIKANILLVLFEQGLFPGLYTALISVAVIIFQPKRSLA